MGPPGVGKSFLVQALGYEAIKQGFVVLSRSRFAVVRDFLHDEAFGGEERMLSKYLKPDLLIIDDMGMKQLPEVRELETPESTGLPSSCIPHRRQ